MAAPPPLKKAPKVALPPAAPMPPASPTGRVAIGTPTPPASPAAKKFKKANGAASPTSTTCTPHDELSPSGEELGLGGAIVKLEKNASTVVDSHYVRRLITRECLLHNISKDLVVAQLAEAFEMTDEGMNQMAADLTKCQIENVIKAACKFAMKADNSSTSASSASGMEAKPAAAPAEDGDDDSDDEDCEALRNIAQASSVPGASAAEETEEVMEDEDGEEEPNEGEGEEEEQEEPDDIEEVADEEEDEEIKVATAALAKLRAAAKGKGKHIVPEPASKGASGAEAHDYRFHRCRHHRRRCCCPRRSLPHRKRVWKSSAHRKRVCGCVCVSI
jgi:hypothetical protein